MRKSWIALGGLIMFSLAAPVCWAAPRDLRLVSPFDYLNSIASQKVSPPNPLGYDSNPILIAAKKKKKKKAKHNYRTYTPFTVTGDENNADYTDTEVNDTGSTSEYYRKVAISGLRSSNPFDYALLQKSDVDYGFGGDIWFPATQYRITDGNIWLYYGWKNDPGAYHDDNPGSSAYFTYYGGAEKKARKNPAYKVYNFTVTGDESNPDVVTTLYSGASDNYYFRRLDIPDLKMDNLMDFRIFWKWDHQINGQDAWVPFNYTYFITDGAIYVIYGDKYEGTYYSDYTGDFRVFIYSNGKKKKRRLTKQYYKKYSFTALSGASNADKTYSTDSVSEYFKQMTIPGLKLIDYPNLRVFYKSKFDAGIGQETWSPGIVFAIEGNLMAWYGGSDIDGSGYTDLASGEYRVFQYK